MIAQTAYDDGIISEEQLQIMIAAKNEKDLGDMALNKYSLEHGYITEVQHAKILGLLLSTLKR